MIKIAQSVKKVFFCGFHPHPPTFLKKSWTKNFHGKTSVFPYQINIFSGTLVSH